MARQQLDDGAGMRGKVAKILAEHQDEMNAVLDVETQHSIQRGQRDFFRFRRERRGLAEGAAKIASARGEQNTQRERPPSGKAEASDQRWMLNVIEMRPKPLSTASSL